MTAFAESFAVGIVSSLHCAGMCGPIGLCLFSGAGPMAGYHFGRAGAYLAAGAALGAAGGALGASSVPSAWVAFLLAGGLLVFAAGKSHWLGSIPGLGSIAQRVFKNVGRWHPAARATGLGVLTPLLPCGLLYAIYGAAILAGSWSAGAATMLGFALGSAPLLILMHVQGNWIRGLLGPDRLQVVQRVAIAAAAGILVWRGAAGLGAECH